METTFTYATYGPKNLRRYLCHRQWMSKLNRIWTNRGMVIIAVVSLVGIVVHLILRYGLSNDDSVYKIPLLIVLVVGGIPLVFGLLKKLAKFEFGSDLLAGISIVTAVWLGEYLAGALVVLMLSGGEAIESYAIRSASSVLRALAQRMPSIGHRRQDGQLSDVPLSEVIIGDTLVLFPHDICPVAIIGAISLCARRGIIVKNPVVLETIATCRTAIFDKTGTLTYGRPRLTDQIMAANFEAREVLGLVASLERYSKHPLAHAIMESAERAGQQLQDVSEISELPGQGLRGTVGGHSVRITSRGSLTKAPVDGVDQIPPHAGGLECFVVVDERFAAVYRFRDEPRAEGVSFIKHLNPKHGFNRVMIVSGDRESEVRYLAEQIGIHEIMPRKRQKKK